MSVPIVSHKLIGEIYEASSRPEHWQIVLSMIAKDINADSATLIYRDLDSPTSNIGYVHSNQSPEECAQMVMEYENYYHKLDPMWKLTAEVGEIGVGIADSLLGLSREEYEAQCPADYLENYMRKYDRWYVAGSNIFQDEDKALVIAAQRGIKSQPWTDKEMDYLTTLTPHFQRAFRIHREFSELRSSVNQLESCINRLLMGLIIVKPSGKISFINELARKIIAAHPVLTNNNGILKATPPHNDNLLQELISNVRESSIDASVEPTRNVAAIALKMDQISPPLPILITTTEYISEDNQTQNSDLTARSRVAIYFADPERSQQYSLDIISEFYGLTRAEAGVAIAISNGYTVSAYARLNGITEHTVRTQIKHIFQKLNISRQVELVKILMQTPNITLKKNIKKLPPK